MFSKQFKSYVQNAVLYLRELFLHNEYSAKVEFSDVQTYCNGNPVTAEINHDDVYLAFTITCRPRLWMYWVDKNYYAVGEVLAHEMSHLLTGPLKRLAEVNIRPSDQDEVDETVERQTQRICNIVMRLLPNGWYTPEKLKRLVA